MRHWLTGIGIMAAATAWAGEAPPHAEHEAHAVEAGVLQPPADMQAEHEKLHEELAAAARAGGRTAEAAKALQETLHPHFVEENRIAMPPIGLLREVAEGAALVEHGKPTPRVAAALEMTRKLREQYPGMLKEHEKISAAAKALSAAARAENKPQAAEFAEELIRHAHNEEAVLYPAALILGDYLRLKVEHAGH